MGFFAHAGVPCALALSAAACSYDWQVGGGGAGGDASVQRVDGGSCTPAKCTCGPRESCSLSCQGLGCAGECGGESQCTVACPLGGCDNFCGEKADCTFSCTGTACTATCKAGSTCTMSCLGSGCSLHCEGAKCKFSVCPDNDCKCDGTGCQ